MTINANHFDWQQDGDVGLVTLNRPARKNPLTFESYAELRDTFRVLVEDDSVRAVVISGQGGNFCSGGDVNDIIAPLTKMDMGGLLDFTRMTGDLVKAIRNCPQPVIAAIDGVCVGAGVGGIGVDVGGVAGSVDVAVVVGKALGALHAASNTSKFPHNNNRMMDNI